MRVVSPLGCIWSPPRGAVASRYGNHPVCWGDSPSAWLVSPLWLWHLPVFIAVFNDSLKNHQHWPIKISDGRLNNRLCGLVIHENQQQQKDLISRAFFFFFFARSSTMLLGLNSKCILWFCWVLTTWILNSRFVNVHTAQQWLPLEVKTQGPGLCDLSQTHSWTYNSQIFDDQGISAISVLCRDRACY